MYINSSFSVTYATKIISTTTITIFSFCQLSPAAALPPVCAVTSRVALVAASARVTRAQKLPGPGLRGVLV